MTAGKKTRMLLMLMVVCVCDLVTTSFGGNVTYDHRALVIDGKRRLLVAGSIHYPRSTPEMWADLIQKSKDGGLDMIQTYVFWNLHEPVRGQYDFSGRKDLAKFVKLVGDAGLYVHLRIGPYACAEWNYGGFPLWLHFIPGIEFRTNNEPFKEEMQRFTAYIVDLMKKNNLYASQGGPIILSQIENEYGNVAVGYGAGAKPYVRWAANMAVSLDTGVPWVMCQQSDAPDPVINTCNGFYCDQFTPNSNQKPKMWTENWSGWFSSFGSPIPYRPVEDLAFAVARFYQRGGTMQNYYMYHGGTNFGRSAGGPFITTSYDYDAPIDEYGIVRQPKWGHLRDVHKAIKLCEAAMVATDPTYSSLGPNLEATVYKTESGLCSAFLANMGAQSDATVNFNGNSYKLSAWSVSILPDCKTVVLNTAKINSMAMLSKFTPQSLKYNLDSSAGVIQPSWSWFAEPVGISKKAAFTRPGLLEQINTTADKSDYLWYSSSIDIKGDEPFLQNGSQAILHVSSLGHGLHAFFNGKLVATKFPPSPTKDTSITADIPTTFSTGTNTIDFLSLTVGLQNYGQHFDTRRAGITGPASLRSSSGGLSVDLSAQSWTYQVGMKGEDLDLSSGSSTVWDSSAFPMTQPLTWYKTSFDSPDGTDPVALDFTGMGKGEAWVNGQSIGRYWPTLNAASGGCNNCDYRGSYKEDKCLKKCGQPSQQLYHVPRSWIKPTGNVLVVFEEIGGDPRHISFSTKQIGSLCAHVSEVHPPPVDTWGSDKTGKKLGPQLSLECPSPNQVISSIKFASFGTPQGSCGAYTHGKCRTSKALPTVQKACVGARSCRVDVSINTFGDPCLGVMKSLAVEATCA